MIGMNTDTVVGEWKESLRGYPPLLTPKQVQAASLGIIKAADVYKRNGKEGKKLDLDFRTIGGKIYVTRDSLAAVLAGKPERPL